MALDKVAIAWAIVRTGLARRAFGMLGGAFLTSAWDLFHFTQLSAGAAHNTTLAAHCSRTAAIPPVGSDRTFAALVIARRSLPDRQMLRTQRGTGCRSSVAGLDKRIGLWGDGHRAAARGDFPAADTALLTASPVLGSWAAGSSWGSGSRCTSVAINLPASSSKAPTGSESGPSATEFVAGTPGFANLGGSSLWARTTSAAFLVRMAGDLAAVQTGRLLASASVACRGMTAEQQLVDSAGTLALAAFE